MIPCFFFIFYMKSTNYTLLMWTIRMHPNLLLVIIKNCLIWIWSHLWFAGVHECPPWCSIVGDTVTVHQFFCILHWIQNLNQSLRNELFYPLIPCIHRTALKFSENGDWKLGQYKQKEWLFLRMQYTGTYIEVKSLHDYLWNSKLRIYSMAII